jgi:hypothetical protein
MPCLTPFPLYHTVPLGGVKSVTSCTREEEKEASAWALACSCSSLGEAALREREKVAASRGLAPEVLRVTAKPAELESLASTEKGRGAALSKEELDTSPPPG